MFSPTNHNKYDFRSNVPVLKWLLAALSLTWKIMMQRCARRAIAWSWKLVIRRRGKSKCLINVSFTISSVTVRRMVLQWKWFQDLSECLSHQMHVNKPLVLSAPFLARMKPIPQQLWHPQVKLQLWLQHQHQNQVSEIIFILCFRVLDLSPLSQSLCRHF